MLEMGQRAKLPLLVNLYGNANPLHLELWETELTPPAKRQYILRMMVRKPGSGFNIPASLVWLKDHIYRCDQFQRQMLVNHPYVYVTVRHGVCDSTTDDEWHVDGFSQRKEHLPEQNYIWSRSYPTEVLVQRFDIPTDFDPFRHNIHWYFQDRADVANTVSTSARCVTLLDPYVVHRRPKQSIGSVRTMVRVSFVPIEIEDNSCTQNPMFPKKIYPEGDIRSTLIRYPG